MAGKGRFNQKMIMRLGKGGRNLEASELRRSSDTGEGGRAHRSGLKTAERAGHRHLEQRSLGGEKGKDTGTMATSIFRIDRDEIDWVRGIPPRLNLSQSKKGS